MHFVYIDESADEELIVYSALAVPDHSWRLAKDNLAGMRRQMMERYGVPPSRELHAWKFVSGRGRFKQTLTKGTRANIFTRVLRFGASHLGQVRLFNAVFPLRSGDIAFERLMNRINRNMVDQRSYAVLICDEGKEAPMRRKVRKMGVYNPIPSKYGSWGLEGGSKNIPTAQILEDPVFRDSRDSYFIQLADFCAFALLRRERPTAKIRQHGLHKAFEELAPILVREASRTDPEGILRP